MTQKKGSVLSLISRICSKNPESKKYMLYEGNEKSQYVCKYCGNKNQSMLSLGCGTCSKSPTKKQQPAL